MQITVPYKGLIERVLCDAVIKSDDGVSVKVRAMWDTGATFSAISAGIAQELDLEHAGFNEYTHAAGVETSSMYFATVELEGGWNIGKLKLTALPNVHNFGMIIGMNIIKHGKFCVENVNGNTVFSFSC